MRRHQIYPTFFVILRNTSLLVILITFYSLGSFAKGLEFYDREISLSEGAFSSFSNQLVETHYDQKNDVNELRFSHEITKQVTLISSNYTTTNLSRPIFMVIGQRSGLTVYKKLDPDLDGFYEETFFKVEGKKFAFEELFTFGEGNFYRMRKRYFPITGSNLFKVEVAFKDKKEEPFKITGGYTFSNLESMVENHANPSCLSREEISLNLKFIKPINNIIRSFDIPWPNNGRNAVKFKAKVDSSCKNQMGHFLKDPEIVPKVIYQEAINKGLTCLQKLTKMNDPKNNSFSRILYLNATAGLTGQAIFISPMGETADASVDRSNPSFPRRAEKRSIKDQQVLCSQSPGAFKDEKGKVYLGKASVLPRDSTQIKCNDGQKYRVEYPFISINFQKLNDSSDRAGLSQHERENKLQEVIFHEFLHTTGVPHDEHYDPVKACAIYCFNDSLDADEKEAAERVCAGEGMGPISPSTVENRSRAQAVFNRYFD